MGTGGRGEGDGGLELLALGGDPRRLEIGSDAGTEAVGEEGDDDIVVVDVEGTTGDDLC